MIATTSKQASSLFNYFLKIEKKEKLKSFDVVFFFFSLFTQKNFKFIFSIYI
jgi:hypothetical protein